MNRSAKKTPDIEIYVHQTELETIIDWLGSSFDSLTKQKSAQKQHHYLGIANDESMEILILDTIIDGYTSIWIDSAHSPWKNDMECARDAHKILQNEIRCIKGSWDKSEDPDLWWSVSSDGEGTVIWKTE